ncbi:MAG: hypothetical protein ACOYOK_07270 [Pseudobdellovibrionaceae bacterium]
MKASRRSFLDSKSCVAASFASLRNRNTIPQSLSQLRLDFAIYKTSSGRLLYLLWGIFFLACFGVGFLQARWDAPVKTLIEKTKLHILIHPDLSWSPQDTAFLEAQTHFELSVEYLQNWQSLGPQLISQDPQIDLLIVPQHWSQALIEQGLIQAFPNDYKNLFDPSISSDFLLKQNNDQIFSWPLFWGISYWTHQPLLPVKNKTFEAVFLDDSVFIDKFKQNLLLKNNYVTVKTYNRTSVLQNRRSIKDWIAEENKDAKSRIYEVLEMEEVPQGWTMVPNTPKSLKLYSVVLPLKASHYSEVKNILEVLFSLKWQESYLKQSPWSSTLVDQSQESWPAKKKSSYLREQNLKNLLWLKDRK